MRMWMTTMIIRAMMRKKVDVAIADAAEDGNEDADPVNGSKMMMMVMLHDADADVDDDDGDDGDHDITVFSKRESR